MRFASAVATVLFLAALGNSAWPGAAQAVPAEVYKPVVLTFTGGSHPNPYTAVDMFADFTGPGGRRLRVYAYWDGGQIWRIRFTPVAAGTWSYRTTSTGDASLNGLTGTVAATDTGSAGFIIRDPAQAFAFKRSRGGNVFLMGDTNWRGMSTQGGLTLSVFKTLIDTRASQKFNFLRVYICPLDSAGSPSNANEGGAAFEPWSPDTLNPAYFQAVDRRIEYAVSKGISPALMFGADKNKFTNFFGWGNGKGERYVRYCCARFGAYDILWENFAEVEEYTNYMTLANTVGGWVEKYDPYAHVQSVHTVNSNNEFATQSWLDWIMHQSTNWDLIVQDRTYGKPVMNEEFYYENSGAGATHPHHVDANKVRKGAWNVMTAGATGFAYANTGTVNAFSMPFKGIQYATSPGATYMTYLYNFWTRTKYWQLSPPAGTTSSDLVQTAGAEYVAYLESGGSRTVFIHAGDYTYRWYNPRAGTYTAATSFTSTGGNRSFTAPDANDWVLHVQKSSAGGTNFSVTVDFVSTGKTYSLSTAQAGVRYYIDRSYTIGSLSSTLSGAKMIRTANDDKYVTASAHLKFTVNQPAAVYVAYDKRATQNPSWLNDGTWTQTSLSFAVSDGPASPMRVFSKSVAAGQVTLGGNHAGGATGALSNYVVLIQGSGAAPKSLPEDAWEHLGDTDGDGLMDAFEQANFLDPADPDSDGDGEPDEAELAPSGRTYYDEQLAGAAASGSGGDSGGACGALGIEGFLFLAVFGPLFRNARDRRGV